MIMQLLFFLMKQLYDLSDEPNFKYVLDIYRSISYKAEVRISIYVLIIELFSTSNKGINIFLTQIPCLKLDMELRVKDNKFSK